MYSTCTAIYSQHRRVFREGTRNFSPKAAPRARLVVDLDLRRLTVTGIPPAAWQVLDQYRRPDLAASRAEDREPTIEVAEAEVAEAEVAEAEAASRGAPFATRQPARGSVDPRHYTRL